ncbi:hypothetical protein AYL99_01208 [Fonsecaea erecta]|uniref:Carbohydrate kinase PfkB domain-containing protein n=1 Tax=Fonsecaea erecta TaxID=1367422 RepID=A0A179A0V5_9EURO|nr:hypothetical protein AYL99_01208 [Fonsecaea erecta]OAP65236.1 hypothetical protein AYL99_01208 [Fonsecaea erecta]
MALCRKSLFLRSPYQQCLRLRYQIRENSSGRDRFFRISEEVQDALATGKPVVALETTIYTHGFPYPENVALSSHLESLVRINGGVPATIGILEGKACVGMAPEELIQLVSTAGSENTWKISRRDLGFIGGLGLRGHKLNGGTTIAGTMILAHLAGIKVFATGGLGGVHRGGENSMDVSADLTELGRTPVAVISSGCKSFLDIPRTLEYLETQGVGVGTFADGRQGEVDFPAFFSRDSGVKSPKTIKDETDAAAIIYAQHGFPLQSGLLFANPVPEQSAMAKEEIDSIVATAVAEAEQKGIGGSANTPYILKRIRELSNGASVQANEALIEANVVRGTKVAVELAKLERRGGVAPQRENASKVIGSSQSIKSSQRVADDQTDPGQGAVEPSFQPVEILVAGSLASDTICDHQPLNITSESTNPALHTSNPSTISQSPGGVGRNVAMAAHLAGAKVILASVVADDLAGASLLDHVEKSGLDTTAIRRLSTNDGARTAQYVAVNDTNKDLVLAMADMSIFARPELESPDYWMAKIDESKPKWVVVDANWSPTILSSVLTAAKAHQASVAFEPVSVAKAARLFHKDNSAITSAHVVPNHVVSLASPNRLELTAIYDAARNAMMFESEQWWNTIDNLGLSGSGSRDRLISVAGLDLVERGVPQQCIQLLPFIPNLVTKLGPKGCLLACLLRPGDPRLTRPENAPYVLSRNFSRESGVGGLYMRLIPPLVEVEHDQIVSVNGIGDTMLGVIIAGLAKGRTVEEVLPVAQEAAVLTLKSAEAVSPHVRQIQARLR